MNVLLTGQSGFLGNYIYKALKPIAELTTISRNDADICCDLSSSIPELKDNFDLVVHCAGKAHVIPKTKEEAKDFFYVNLNGTINLCHSLEGKKLPKQIIFISTVAVYGLDSGENITEDAPLLAQTPYALSKVDAENYLQDWCKINGVTLSILRLPLVVGLNPPGNLGTMIKSIKKGYYFRIGKSHMLRSAVLASDVASLIAKGVQGGVFNLVAFENPRLCDFENAIAKHYKKRKIFSIPLSIVKILAMLGNILPLPINSYRLKKLSNNLTFSCSNAVRQLNWSPSKVVDGIFE